MAYLILWCKYNTNVDLKCAQEAIIEALEWL